MISDLVLAERFFFFSCVLVYSIIMGFKSLFHHKKKHNSSKSRSTDSEISVSEMTMPSIHELEEVFKKFDVNGDEKISSSELGSMMSSLGHDVTDEELKEMIREVDSDGDGFIDFKEFVELNTDGVDSVENMENLKDAFSVYDLDGNGSISADELFTVLRCLGDDCTIAECRKMIRGVDCDGDGMVDFEEFKVMMMMNPWNDSIDRGVRAHG